MTSLKELEEENRRLTKMCAEERLKAEIVAEAMLKNGSAISTPGDGAMGSQGKGGPHPACLSGVGYQSNLLPISSQTVFREQRNRGLADSSDGESAKPGFRSMFFCICVTSNATAGITRRYTECTGSLN